MKKTFRSAGRIRTAGLLVMSQTSCHCSTAHYYWSRLILLMSMGIDLWHDLHHR